MTIKNILPGSNDKPAYIEFLKEGNSSPTLLSVQNFRNRFGDTYTDEVLGIEPEVSDVVDEEIAAAVTEEVPGGLFSVAG